MRFGFSPSADFIPDGARSSISSTVRPQHLSATVWPPIGLPEPGLTLTASTPPLIASLKPRSAGLIASMARTFAVTGSVISLVSCPAQPCASSCTPTCPCASMNPGSTQAPAASMTRAAAGTGTSAPIATILPSATRTVPPSICSPTMGTTRPPTIATDLSDIRSPPHQRRIDPPRSVTRNLPGSALRLSRPASADPTDRLAQSAAAPTALNDHATCYPSSGIDPDTALEPLYPDRLGEDFLALTTPGHSQPDYIPDLWAQDAPARLLAAPREVPQTDLAFIRPALITLIETARRWPHVAVGQLPRTRAPAG